MSEIIVGIDLGTTNSEVAIVRDGRVEVIQVSEGNCILPSMVGIGDDGGLLVGEPARNQYVVHPERTIRSIKRRMGGIGHVSMADKDYTPQEISAMILRRLKQVAETYLGQAISKAVITVPAYFSDSQRQATREAGEIAGLEVVRIINEPTAAALAYETGHTGARTVLVYDLGGGTFDVSVVNLENDIVEVKSSHGNNHLGGDDFDQAILRHLLAHLKENQSVELDDAPVAMARLLRAAEKAKIQLTDQPFTTLSEEYLSEREGVPVHLSMELARSDYEALIEALVEETLAAVHTAINGAGLVVSDIDEILLVGGATRTPLIQRRLEEVLGLQPRAEVNPDLCVAMGAAIQAGVISGTQTPTVLVDVTPYTFGTGALSMLNGKLYPHCFIPLIRKNTPIPVTKSESFFTTWDGQDKVEVGVYQGEDPDALQNIEIGQFMIEGLRDVPAGNCIVTSFSLDINGILKVTSKEKDTCLAHSVTIENAIARFSGSKLDEARARIDDLFGGREPAEGQQDLNEQRQRTEAKALVEKAERLLSSAGTEDAEDLVDAIEAMKEALNSETELQPAMDVLSDLIYYLDM